MNKTLIGLALCASFSHADVTLESRNGITALHSEGEPIARYLSQNTITYSYNKFDFILLGNIYGTQDWWVRVKKEEDSYKVDAVRFEYGAEIHYEVNDNWKFYTRHTMPVDRHDTSVNDGWDKLSYRWDSGIIYTYTWK